MQVCVYVCTCVRVYVCMCVMLCYVMYCFVLLCMYVCMYIIYFANNTPHTQTHTHKDIHTYIHTLHYITLHYITLHYITLHTYIHIYFYTRRDAPKLIVNHAGLGPLQHQETQIDEAAETAEETAEGSWAADFWPTHYYFSYLTNNT